VRSLVAASILLAVCCTRGPAAVPQRQATDHYQERLLSVLILALRGESEFPRFSVELERLERLCPAGPSRADCVSRNAKRIRVAQLHAEPTPESAVSGALHVSFRAPANGQDLTLGLDVEHSSKPGAFDEWISDVGDPFYGRYVDGRARRFGEWVQLLGPRMPKGAWLTAQNPNLQVIVDEMVNGIFDIELVRARWPDGRVAEIERANYLVTRIDAGQVEFRAEVPSDFDCGEDLAPPAVLPPLLRAPAAEFFNADGTPRFSTTYTKGC
jgi:hypothetical protein